MKQSIGFNNRARGPVRLLLAGAAIALLGVGFSSLPAGNDPLRELPIQPSPSVGAGFTYPGPQAIYSAP